MPSSDSSSRRKKKAAAKKPFDLRKHLASSSSSLGKREVKSTKGSQSEDWAEGLEDKASEDFWSELEERARKKQPPLAQQGPPVLNRLRNETPAEKDPAPPRMLFGAPTLRTLSEGLAVLLIVAACYFALSLATYNHLDPGWTRYAGTQAAVGNLGGRVGAMAADLAFFLFGYTSLILPILIVWLSLVLFRGHFPKQLVSLASFAASFSLFVVAVFSATSVVSLIVPPQKFGETSLISNLLPRLPENFDSGGVVGHYLGNLASLALGSVGSTLILLALSIVSLLAYIGISWVRLLDSLGGALIWFFHCLFVRVPRASLRLTPPLLASLGRMLKGVDPEAPPAPPPSEAAQSGDDTEALATTAGGAGDSAATTAHQEKSGEEAGPKNADATKKETESNANTEKGEGAIALPSIELLLQGADEADEVDHERLERMSRALETMLIEFSIKVEVAEVHPGPVITRFELKLAPGLKASKIVGLSKDIARALSVAAVRVVEVIPGKSTVGLEIPNRNRRIVRFGDLIKHEGFNDKAPPLTLALGRDIGGQPVFADLARMPHLLAAGATGSGKSVAINSMILSLICRNQPSRLRLIMIDPKMLELSVYDGIPHLLTPVVTDMNDAQKALRWGVAEMERRNRIMAAFKVRNLDGLNQKVVEARTRGEPLMEPALALGAEPSGKEMKTLPFIVVVIDEFADMMMVVGKKVEELITRLAQKARAAGIHLILATQRPSVDVITGIIKANVPSRIAFQVSARVDSRTILDQGGAEQLLGRGDMLYLPPGISMPHRVHGALIEDQEVINVVNFVKEQSEPDYEEQLGPGAGGAPNSFDDFSDPGDSEADPMYDSAVAIVMKSRKASISYIQRQLKIGYNRSARLLEAMEKAGLISELSARGTRELLVPSREDEPPPSA